MERKQLSTKHNGRERAAARSLRTICEIDQGAIIGFEYRFAVARHVQAAFYRSSFEKTIQLYGKYDAVQQRGIDARFDLATRIDRGHRQLSGKVRMFSLTFTHTFATTLAQLARGGAANSLFLGFNLDRKFF